MATDEEADPLLERFIRAAQTPRKGRSRLYRYMRRHFARFAAVEQPDWQSLAEEMERAAQEPGANVPLDADSNVPTATVLRQTWWRVQRDMAKTPPRREKTLRMMVEDVAVPAAPVPVPDARLGKPDRDDEPPSGTDYRFGMGSSLARSSTKPKKGGE